MTESERDQLEDRQMQHLPAGRSLRRRLRDPIFWRTRLLELAVAVVLTIGVIYFSNTFTIQYRKSVVPSAWFVVNELFVPDHRVGENPDMLYDRLVRQPFTGFRVVEVQREEPGGLFSATCQGSGLSTYDTDDFNFANKVKWNWFVGDDCRVEPGRYRLRVRWTIRAEGWPEKQVVSTSNIFEVKP
jgi:hypothetical protein